MSKSKKKVKSKWYHDNLSHKGETYHKELRYYTGRTIHLIVTANGQALCHLLKGVTGQKPKEVYSDLRNAIGLQYTYLRGGKTMDIVILSYWSYEVAAHEFTHCMFSIDHDLGLKTSFRNQESYAYGVGWMMEEYCKMKKNKRKYLVKMPVFKKP